MYDLIIRDATIIHSGGREVADIAVEDGKIVHVGGTAPGQAKEEVSAIGRLVIPGIIDANVCMREVGRTGGLDWASGSRAAAASGVTTLLDMPDGDELTLTKAQVEEKLAAAKGQSIVNYGVWVAANKDNLSELPDIHGHGLACGTMVYMDAEEGDIRHLNGTGLPGVLEATQGLVGVHAEDPSVIEKHRRKWEEVEDPVHNDVRPPKAAAAAVQHVIDVVKETGRKVHIRSLSTVAELNMLDPHRGDLPITSAVLPSHLFLSVETAGKLGDMVKQNPPVRTEFDRRALWAAIKRGRIDTFASGHFPLTSATKDTGYWNVPAGIPGVEMLYPLLMNAVKYGRLGLERLVEMCCENPAALFDLESKGHIKEGYDADFILFKEGDTTKMKKPLVHSSSDWTPYIGREIGVLPELVVINGQVVSRKGVLMDDISPGKSVAYIRS